MSNPREYDDGRLVYPRRGNPPEVPKGYVASAGDPWILEPVFPPCPYREYGTRPCGTCYKESKFAICNKGFPAHYKVCLQCVESGRLAGFLKQDGLNTSGCRPIGRGG